MIARCSILKRAVTGAALACCVCGMAAAQSYPAKPIRFVIPYPPGGASDVTARVLGAKMTETWGQQVIVDNRPGANGIIALELVAKARPDGYTILMANLGPNAINPSVYSKLPYDAIKDFSSVTLTTLVPLLMVVHPSLPVKSVKDLVAVARRSSGQLNFASAGVGASNHLAGELFKMMTSVKMLHVPYKGDTPAMTDVIAGQVAVMFPTAIAAMPHVKAGRLHALAATSVKRIGAMPQLPTVAESVPGFEAVSWGGIMTPAGAPAEVISKLHGEITRILRLPDVGEKMSGLGAEIVASSPEEFAAYLKGEINKWSKVARAAGVTLDQ